MNKDLKDILLTLVVILGILLIGGWAGYMDGKTMHCKKLLKVTGLNCEAIDLKYDIIIKQEELNIIEDK